MLGLWGHRGRDIVESQGQRAGGGQGVKGRDGGGMRRAGVWPGDGVSDGAMLG